MTFDKLGSVQADSIQLPYGSPPVPTAGYTNLYRKTEDNPKFYYMDSSGTEHEFNADGLSKLAAGNGVQIYQGEDEMVYIAILQSPNSIGMIALDSLHWNPATLPAKTTTLLSKALLVINEGVAGFKSTERITFTDLLNLLSSRARFVDVPAGPATPGVEGDYSYKDGYRYQWMQTGIGQGQWVRWQVQTSFQNEGGTTIPVPTNLQATLLGNNINLTWGYNSMATGFELFASAGDAGSFQKVEATLGGTDRAHLFVPPSSDMQYFFELRAITAQGTSGVSNRANATSLPSANRWAAIQNLVLTPNASNSTIQASFNALNAGTTVRLDITRNANAQADPIDPKAQGWDDQIYLTITSPGNKTVEFKGINDTNIRKVRALVFGNGKEASIWVMAGPVSLTDEGELTKPTISGLLDSNNASEIKATIPGGLSGVLLLIQRRQGTSGDWASAGQSSQSYDRIPGGSQAPGTSYQYRAYYVTQAGVRSKYSDVITLTAQAASILAPTVIGQDSGIPRTSYGVIYWKFNGVPITGWNNDYRKDDGPWIRWFENRNPPAPLYEPDTFQIFSHHKANPETGETSVYRYRWQAVTAAGVSPWSNLAVMNHASETVSFEPADQTPTGQAPPLTIPAPYFDRTRGAGLPGSNSVYYFWSSNGVSITGYNVDHRTESGPWERLFENRNPETPIYQPDIRQANNNHGRYIRYQNVTAQGVSPWGEVLALKESGNSFLPADQTPTGQTPPQTIPAPYFDRTRGAAMPGSNGTSILWSSNGADVIGWNIGRRIGDGPWELEFGGTTPNLDPIYPPDIRQYFGLSGRSYRFQNITSQGTSLWSEVLVLRESGNYILDPDQTPTGEIPGGGGTSDGVTYQLQTVATYKSGNHDPWAIWGYYENPYIPGGVVYDLVGGAHPLPYSLSSMLQKISKLGIPLVGNYSKLSDVQAGLADWNNREALANKYVYLNQSSYAITNPLLPPSEHDEFRQQLWDNNPTGYDYDWVMDDNQVLRLPAGTPIKWNIVWAKYHQAGNGDYNSDFNAVRVNCEHHELEHWGQVMKVRYLGQAGRYRPARVGGSFAGDGPYSGSGALTDADYAAGKEPAYKDMSDHDFYNFYYRCQVSYDERWYRTWKDNGRITLGYQAESSPGYFQEIGGVKGYRRTNLFRTKSFNGKRYKDFMTACCRFGGDIQLDMLPFVMVYKDEMDDWLTNIYHLADDIGLQEDNVTRTGNLTAGAPEYYRYSIDANRKLKIYFEDLAGNTRKTTRPMQIVSAFTKDGNNFGNSVVWAEIPLGTSEMEIQIGNEFVKPSNLTKRVDEELVKQLEYVQLYSLDMIAQGLEGYPIQNQLYSYVCGYRGAELNLEIQNVGQMPKKFVHGLRLMGRQRNYIHVVYNALSVNGMRTADHIFAAEKRMHKYNAHWNDNKKSVEVEVSMDGGNTWTSPEIATWRSDIASDFLVPNPQAYNALWITNRAANNQASPLVYVSFNTATGTVVITETVVFGNSLTYSFRFKKPDGTYATYLNRQINNEWKDNWGSAVPTPDPDPDPEPEPQPSEENAMIVGNSMTRHGVAAHLGWNQEIGMAASTESKDYVHLFEAAIKAINPANTVVLGNGNQFETLFDQNYNFSEITYICSTQNITTLIIRYGDNVDDSTAVSRNIKGALGQMVDAARAARPTMKFVLSGSYWARPIWDSIVQQVVAEKNTAQSPIVYVSLEGLDTFENAAYGQYPAADPAVQAHPGDKGMQAIFTRMLAGFVQVTGQTTPQPGDDWETVPSDASTNVPQQTVYLENQYLKIGFNFTAGGAVTHLSKGGDNWVNNMDLGRQFQYAIYQWPVEGFRPNGQEPHPAWTGIGYNPIQTGDVSGVPSKVLQWKQIDANTLYFRSKPMQWAYANVPGDCYVDSFVRLNGKVVEQSNIIHNQRTDPYQLLPRGQEILAGYLNSQFWKIKAYMGNQPFQNVATQDIDMSAPPAGFPVNSQNQWEMYLPENWIYAYAPNRAGQGVGIWGESPLFTVFQQGQKDLPGSGEFEHSFGYIGAQMNSEQIDRNAIIRYRFAYVMGTEAETRAYAAANRSKAWKLDFDFSKDRQHWVVRHDYQEKATEVPFPGYWGIDYSTDMSNFQSPDGSWNCSDYSAIEITMAITGNQSQVGISFLKQNNNGYPYNHNGYEAWTDFALNFPVTADGQFRTYTIPLAGNAGWQGIVRRIYLDVGGQAAAGRSIKLKSIKGVRV